ncbi:MAG: hypothetical protein V3T42_12645 [Nitrospirales bacterium]
MGYLPLGWQSRMGVLNISRRSHIHARGSTDISSWRECSKKSVQQGRSQFDARSVQRVREQGKMARTPLAAFFNIPIMGKPPEHTWVEGCLAICWEVMTV